MKRLFVFGSFSVLLALTFISQDSFARGPKRPDARAEYESHTDVIIVRELESLPAIVYPPVVVVAQPMPVVVVPPPPPAYIQVYPSAVVAPSYLTLTNLSGYTAISVRIWPSGSCCDGPELLSASGDLYMRSGSVRSLSLPANSSCFYDFQVEYLENVAPSKIRRANLCQLTNSQGESRWTIGAPPSCGNCD